jgi:hypothetical protein
MKFLYGMLLLGVFFLAGAALATEERFNIPLDDSPRLGPENGPVTIIEFLDFQ